MYLAKIPAHKAILSNNPYLTSAILRWQRKHPLDQTHDACDTSSSSSSSSSPRRPQVVLTLQAAEEQPAAEAVLMALYGVEPIPQLLSKLTQKQQLQAALLADLWVLPEISTATVQLLVAAAKSQQGLAASTTDALLCLPGYPICLQPLLQEVLLPTLGDLETTWSHRALRSKLLRLPTCALEALLSDTRLKVASEDTVLYTVLQYVGNIADPEQRSTAMQQLVPLIRFPHLSSYWLALLTTSCDATHPTQSTADMLVAMYGKQLKQLLLFKLAGGKCPQDAASLQRLASQAPASWSLGQRVQRPVSSVQLEWEVDVDAIRNAARQCASSQQRVRLPSNVATPPLGGLHWSLQLKCVFTAGGTRVGAYAYARVPFGRCTGDQWLTVYKNTLKLSVAGTRIRSDIPPDVTGRGVKDFFGIGPMSGGWSEDAWAARGLPTEGKIVITMHVTKLEHHGSS